MNDNPFEDAPTAGPEERADDAHLEKGERLEKVAQMVRDHGDSP